MIAIFKKIIHMTPLKPQVAETNTALTRETNTKPGTSQQCYASPNKALPGETGRSAETLAQRFLTQQGLTYRDKNFRCKLGEIDLIVEDRDCLVFVEVRYRKQNSFGSPAATVTQRKQAKLVRTALFFLNHTEGFSPHRTRFRFDVVQIQPVRKQHPQPDQNNDNGEFLFENHQITWLKSAFEG